VLTLAKVVFQTALAAWVGALVTVSFLVAPTVFRALPSETAGTVMGQIFPLYYGCTAVSGVVALGAAVWLARKASGARPWPAIVAMLAVMLAATTYAGAVVSPKARELRPALHREPVDPAVRSAFDALHRRAVQLNGLVLVLGLVTIGLGAVSMRLPGEQ
jgi:hypothetical protein